jgi:secreted trypsin-like serine protease/TPR repeat protein
MAGMDWWLRGAMAFALGLAATGGGAPLHAQDEPAPYSEGQSYGDLPEPPPMPIPYSYDDQDGPDPAPRDKLPRIAAREEAAAARAEQACDAGDQAGCTALGKAYLYGSGRPQNRHIAELLLREACGAEEAAACHELGTLFGSIRKDQPYYFGRQAHERACNLGLLDACEDLAVMLAERDPENRPGDPQAAAMLRRETCARGGLAACTTLAQQQFERGADPATQRAGKARLETLCAEGSATACTVLINSIGQDSEPRTPTDADLRALLDKGCTAGVADACERLGRAVFAESAGPPEQRSAALALFERACDLSLLYCQDEREIVTAPQLKAACSAGDQAQCAMLGEILSGRDSLLFQPVVAAGLLGGACDAGIVSACRSAGELLLIHGAANAPMGPDQTAAALRWSLAACDADADDCQTIGNRLVAGNGLPEDRPLGYALLSRACEAQYSTACDRLTNLAHEDPDAPLPLASSRLRPPMTEEEEAAYQDEVSADRAAYRQAARAQDCVTTTTIFRGTSFTDTICTMGQRLIGGFVARVGEAPWQALIWRPASLGGTPLGLRDRVTCGGTLVATGWVLTAAHCLVDKFDPARGLVYAIDRHPYRIRLGMSGLSEDEGNSYPILRVIRHKDYDPRTLAFDVALIQYDTRAGSRGRGTFGAERIAIDRLSPEQRPVVAGRPVYAYGFGVTSVTGRSATQLQGVKLLLRSAKDCEGVTGFRTPPRRNAAVCAAGANNQQACYGDSGGPLVLYGSHKENPVLFGVVSGGWECGTTDQKLPSQYVRLGHEAVRAWLASHLPGFRSGMPGS